MANPFVHVELNTTDVAQAKNFYGTALRLENGRHADGGRRRLHADQAWARAPAAAS